MMKVEITKQRIIEDIRIKSHYDAQHIKDLEERDAARVDDEDVDEITRDLINAVSSLYGVAGRYLEKDTTYMAGDALSLPATIVFKFSFAERRLDGKAQALADAIHSYLVNYTLSLFYNAAANADMAQKRAQMALADRTLVETLVFTKKAPYKMSN